jgi:hypothetical protein
MLAGPTTSCTYGAFFPIVDAISALIQALAGLSVEHLPTSAIGEADVVSDLPAIRAVRHGQRLFFHKARFYSVRGLGSVPFRTLRESLSLAFVAVHWITAADVRPKLGAGTCAIVNRPVLSGRIRFEFTVSPRPATVFPLRRRPLLRRLTPIVQELDVSVVADYVPNKTAAWDEVDDQLSLPFPATVQEQLIAEVAFPTHDANDKRLSKGATSLFLRQS